MAASWVKGERARETCEKYPRRMGWYSELVCKMQVVVVGALREWYKSEEALSYGKTRAVVL